MRLVSKADFARERSVHPSRVTQWLKSSRIRADENGRIDADVAHELLNKSLDQAKGARPSGNLTSVGPAPIEQLPLGERPAGDAAGAEQPKAAAAAKGSGRDDSDYWHTRTRQAKAEAELKEMQVLERAGALVSAPDVAREIREIFRMTRNAMLAVPDRVAAVLDPASPSRAHKLLTEELQKGLRELFERLDQRAGAGTATTEERSPALQ